MPEHDPRLEVHLSVVSPAYNEAENLEGLVSEVAAAMSGIGKNWELLIIDDGSTDNSVDILRRLQVAHAQLRVIRLSCNCGQTAALDAGLRHCRGRFIGMVDADRQNDPAELPRLLALVESGQCDFANGWRARRNDPWLRLVSTRIANGVRNWLTHEQIHDSACGLKLFRRQCIVNLKLFQGMHRFLPTLVRMEGFTVREIEVNHRPRVAGKAKYGVWNRVFKALRDTFAIRWMQSRTIRYEAAEMERSNG